MSLPQYGARPLYCPTGKGYFIGDIHNEADKLIELLAIIEPMLTPEDHIIFCGDLINRGIKAARTIEVLVEFAEKYPTQTFFIRGNHDWMLESYLVTGNTNWLSYLQPSLANLMAEWVLPDTTPATISQALLDYGFKEIVSRTIPYYETADLVATHALLEHTTCEMFGLSDYEEDYNDRANNPGFRYFLERIENGILWDFADENRPIPDFKKFRIHGHQPAHHGSPRIFKDRAFIDTGCGKGNRPLTCMVYPGKQYWQSSK